MNYLLQYGFTKIKTGIKLYQIFNNSFVFTMSFTTQLAYAIYRIISGFIILSHRNIHCEDLHKPRTVKSVMYHGQRTYPNILSVSMNPSYCCRLGNDSIFLFAVKSLCRILLNLFCFQASVGLLNIKMSSYRFKDPRVKDKTVTRPSYLWHGNSIFGNMFFILRRAPVCGSKSRMLKYTSVWWCNFGISGVP